ncbi:acyl-coenzyme A thioesterase 1 isoform X2 [Microcaecilia unicolor]|uniref:Acyl-coenzyme A thioesterase 1 isoform X2 n=1 Tax=Microcaecilia unicolor TaxID=1415580 RepID=A0A6P7YQY6_9AMPH|nr:acyl-coenzyme A thioesterase 1 isoform X2 [Microcaecilia unicolor]
MAAALRAAAARGLAFALWSSSPGPALVRKRSDGGPVLTASPQTSLADESLSVAVRGLEPRQRVTLRAQVVSQQGCLFNSCAHYQADESGCLDLATAPSTGGDYTGVEPMGLFWGLAPAGMEKQHQRLEHSIDVEEPMIVEMLVHEGFSQPKSSIHGPVLARIKVQRQFAGPGVRKIRLREGVVRGSLFIPPGDGPFPGVIDMFGDEGGLLEFRSSLLANRGFAALALPYFGFEDLPVSMKDFQLEYFEQTARFLQRHPKVKGQGVGVVGSGKGADLALSMVTFLPEVVAAVSISGCCSNTAADLHYGELTLPGLCYDMSQVIVSEANVFDIFEALDDPLDPANECSIIPIEKAEGHILFVVGDDDRNWKSSLYAEIAIKRLQQHGKKNYELLSYPGAGHRIDPPYSPFCMSALDRVLGVPILGGGKIQPHGHAQVHSWQKIQEFFNIHLR